MDINPTQQFTAGPNPPKRSGSIWKVIAVAAIALVLVAGTVLAAFAFMMNTPKNQFMGALFKDYKNNEKKIKEVMEMENVQVLQSILEQPTEISAEQSGSISGDFGEYGSKMEMILELLEKAKIKTNTKIDLKQDRVASNFAVALSGSDLAGFDAYVDQRNISLRMPILFDKYFTIDGSNFKQCMNNLDMYGAYPEQLPTISELRTLINFPEEQVKAIGLDYGKYMYLALKKEDFKVEKNVTLDTGDTPIKGKKIVLTLSEDRVQTVINDLLDKLSNDDKTLDLLVDNGYNVIDFMKKFNEDMEEEVKDFDEKSELKSLLKDGANEAKDMIKEIKLPEGITIALLVDKKGNVVSKQYNFVVDDQASGTEVAFEISDSQWKNADKTEKGKLEIQISNKDDDMEKASLLLTSSTVPGTKQEPEATKLALTAQVKKDGDEAGKVTGDIDIKHLKAADETEKIDVDYKISVSGDPSDGDSTFGTSGTISQKINGTVKKKEVGIESDMSIKVNSTAEDMEYTVETKSKENYKFPDTLDFPVLSADNSVDIKNMDSAQREEIGSSLQSSIMAFYMKNMSLFQSFLK